MKRALAESQVLDEERKQQEDEEEEMMRRAMEASMREDGENRMAEQEEAEREE